MYNIFFVYLATLHRYEYIQISATFNYCGIAYGVLLYFVLFDMHMNGKLINCSFRLQLLFKLLFKKRQLGEIIFIDSVTEIARDFEMQFG